MFLPNLLPRNKGSGKINGINGFKKKKTQEILTDGNV